ncbi:hypothetical protein FPOAC2_10795 [Fusarium poae]|jgi:hypothetical protein
MNQGFSDRDYSALVEGQGEKGSLVQLRLFVVTADIAVRACPEFVKARPRAQQIERCAGSHTGYPNRQSFLSVGDKNQLRPQLRLISGATLVLLLRTIVMLYHVGCTIIVACLAQRTPRPEKKERKKE